MVTGFGILAADFASPPAWQKCGRTHFDEFIQIAGRDGHALDPLEERIAFVLSLIEDTPVKRHPGLAAVEIPAGSSLEEAYVELGPKHSIAS